MFNFESRQFLGAGRIKILSAKHKINWTYPISCNSVLAGFNCINFCNNCVNLIKICIKQIRNININLYKKYSLQVCN